MPDPDDDPRKNVTRNRAYTGVRKDEDALPRHRAPRGARAGREKDLAAREKAIRDEKSLAPTETGDLVLRSSRGHAWLEDPSSKDGERHVLLPRWAQVVPGDLVAVDPQGRVNGAVPRRTMLVRQVGPQQQVLASNLDQLAMVVAPGPLLREGFLNRALAIAAAARLTPIIVFQKLDLDVDREMRKRAKAYSSIAEVHLTSVKSGEGVAGLKKALARKTTAFLGHSGVGKSSLVNAMYPEAKLRTSDVDSWGKGRHTTTLARAIRFPDAMLIDLPGVRELGLPRFDDEVRDAVFPDLRIAEAACAEENPTCKHDDPETCLVLKASDKGLVDAQRWQAYRAILDSFETGLEGGGRL